LRDRRRGPAVPAFQLRYSKRVKAGGPARLESDWYHRSVRIKRLPMRESVIRRTTILCQQLGAINLSQGFPDDGTFPELKQLAVEAIAGANHQYTDPWGSPVLRCALARKLRDFNGIIADPDRNIVITCGATEGMI